MKIFLLLTLFIISLNISAQGGSGGGEGGPGMVLKYLDNNGILRTYVTGADKVIPIHIMNQYLKNLGNKAQSLREISEAEREFINIGNAMDVMTTEGRNFDREALRSIRPSWMKEEGGDLWVETNAPILDYQTNYGAVVDFKEALEKIAPSEPTTRFPEDDEE